MWGRGGAGIGISFWRDRAKGIAKRERVLSDDEIGEIWRAAGGAAAPYGAIVRLLILTGQWRGEIGALRGEWCSLPPPEADEDFPGHGAGATGAQISLPGGATKNRRSHTFPIADVTAAVLRRPTTVKGVLYPARGSTDTPFNGWSKAKAQLDMKAGIAPWTLHDLRRTYATNLQRLDIKLEVIEALCCVRGADRVGIKIAPGFTVNDTFDDDPAETYTYLARCLNPLGLAYLNVGYDSGYGRGTAPPSPAFRFAITRFRSAVYFHHGFFGAPSMYRTAAINV